MQRSNNVTFITDIYYYSGGLLVKGGEQDCILPNELRLIRVNYDKLLNGFITNKIQKVSKINALLNEIKPDSILYHGTCGYELMDVSQYVATNPHVKFYVDSHEDFHNTARNLVSKFALNIFMDILLNER